MIHQLERRHRMKIELMFSSREKSIGPNTSTGLAGKERSFVKIILICLVSKSCLGSNFLLSLLLSHASSTSFSTPLEIHKVIAGVHLHEIYASGNSFCEARVNMGVQVYFRAFAGYMHRPTESTSTRHTSEVTSVKLAGIRKKVSKTVRGISSTMWCSWSCSKISHDRIASRACPIMYYFLSLVALCAHCDFCLAFKRT